MCGHGKSGKPRGTSQYGVEMARDVIRLLDHLQISRAHMVGYSMGGFIVMNLLAAHPDRFLTATLGGSGGVREDFPLDDFCEKFEVGRTRLMQKDNLRRLDES